MEEMTSDNVLTLLLQHVHDKVAQLLTLDVVWNDPCC